MLGILCSNIHMRSTFLISRLQYFIYVIIYVIHSNFIQIISIIFALKAQKVKTSNLYIVQIHTRVFASLIEIQDLNLVKKELSTITLFR